MIPTLLLSIVASFSPCPAGQDPGGLRRAVLEACLGWIEKVEGRG